MFAKKERFCIGKGHCVTARASCKQHADSGLAA
jgi:hypothetical protein